MSLYNNLKIGLAGVAFLTGVGTTSNYCYAEQAGKINQNTSQVYVVQKGDRLYDIVKDHNVSLEDLQRFNPDIRNIDLIKIGQRINLADLESKVSNQISDVNDTNKINYTTKELKELQNILYAEAANQSTNARRLIARVIVNRVKDNAYPNTIQKVIYDPRAFSCINDKNNPNWKQATGKKDRNEYEELVYGRCFEDANSVLRGEKLGIPYEEEIIAYHDKSVDVNDLVKEELKLKEKYKKQGKVYNGYWMNLEPVAREGRLIFYRKK